METMVLAAAVLAFAVVLIGVGLAARMERLPRNRWLGIRVAAVQANDDAWRNGHHAAAGAIIAAAGPPLLLAAALLVMPPNRAADWLLVYIVVGVVTGGLIGVAVRQATRAATETTSS
jgi:hypothetical protein